MWGKIYIFAPHLIYKSMASVNAFIRVSSRTTREVNVRFRLRDGRKVDLFHSSDIKVKPSDFDSRTQLLKARNLIDPKKRYEFNSAISKRRNLILDIYNKTIDKSNLSSEWLDITISRELNQEKCNNEIKKDFFPLFQKYIIERRLAKKREEHYYVLMRALKRFELYKDLVLDYNLLSTDLLNSIRDFFENEADISKEIPELYEDCRKLRPRGHNRIVNMMNMFKSFFNWLLLKKHTTNNPFENFVKGSEIYGTPFFLTIDERNIVNKTILKENPNLATAKDIFIVHCFLGCRVGDLMEMTKKNIINDAIEYYPNKTKAERTEIIRVPLLPEILDIINKYNDTERLLPFLPEQDYNEAIRKILFECKVVRIVSIMNPLTLQTEQKPIWQVASSHVCRRTFIGNLYNKVKDPEIIGQMSGHAPGSKSFSRYRTINDDTMLDAIKLLS
jgi:integrase